MGGVGVTAKRPPVPEADVQRVLTDALSARGWRWVHFRPARTKDGWRTAFTGATGFPDVIAARDGRMLALECKGSRGRVTPDQALWLGKLGAVPGVQTMIVTPENLDEALEVIAG